MPTFAPRARGRVSTTWEPSPFAKGNPSECLPREADASAILPAVPSGWSPAGGGGRLPSPVRSVCSEPLQWMQSGRGPACTCLPPPARDGGLVKRFSPDLLSCSPISIASACPVSICNENNKTSEAGITSLSCRTTRRISIIRNLRCTGALTRPFQEGLGSASCIYITLKSLSPRAK